MPEIILTAEDRRYLDYNGGTIDYICKISNLFCEAIGLDVLASHNEWSNHEWFDDKLDIIIQLDDDTVEQIHEIIKERHYVLKEFRPGGSDEKFPSNVWIRELGLKLLRLCGINNWEETVDIQRDIESRASLLESKDIKDNRK